MRGRSSKDMFEGIDEARAKICHACSNEDKVLGSIRCVYVYILCRHYLLVIRLSPGSNRRFNRCLLCA